MFLNGNSLPEDLPYAAAKAHLQSLPQLDGDGSVVVGPELDLGSELENAQQGNGGDAAGDNDEEDEEDEEFEDEEFEGEEDEEDEDEEDEGS